MCVSVCVCVGAAVSASVVCTFSPSFFRTWPQFRTHRPEPLAALAALYRAAGSYALAEAFAILGLQSATPPPDADGGAAWAAAVWALAPAGTDAKTAVAEAVARPRDRLFVEYGLVSV